MVSWEKLVLRWTLFVGKSNNIISVSNFTKSLIQKLRLKTRVINNGIDIDEWSPADNKVL